MLPSLLGPEGKMWQTTTTLTFMSRLGMQRSQARTIAGRKPAHRNGRADWKTTAAQSAHTYIRTHPKGQQGPLKCFQ